MLCFRLVLWSVVLVFMMIPGAFLAGIIGRLAGFRPGSTPGPVEQVFGWVGIIVLGAMMLGVCLIGGLIDWGVSTAVQHAQNFPQPAPFNPPPINPPPVEQPRATPNPIPPEWVEAKMEKTYLSDMQEFGVRVGWGGFGKKGKLGYLVGGGDDIKFGGRFYSNSISMHPPTSGFSTVKYRLNKEFKLFLANAALSDTEHPAFVPSTPAIFRVYGDAQLLWVSAPIQQSNVRDGCRVNVEGFEILELQIHCNGHNAHVRGVWLEPFLLK